MFCSTWSLRMFFPRNSFAHHTEEITNEGASTKSSWSMIEVKSPILFRSNLCKGSKDSRDKNIEREDPVRPCARLQSKLPAFARHSGCGSPPIIARAVIERRVDI